MTESDTERNHLQISSSLFGLLGTLLGFIIPDMFRPKTGMAPSFFPLQIAMVVVDSCVIPQPLMDEAKRLAEKATGIPAGRLLEGETAKLLRMEDFLGQIHRRAGGATGEPRLARAPEAAVGSEALSVAPNQSASARLPGRRSW